MDIKEKAYNSIQKIKSALNENNLSSTSISEKNYNYEITVTMNRVDVKIQVYFGKKGIKTIIQGDTKSPEYKLIQNLIQDQPVLDFAEKKLNEPFEYIGSDECGKGDFFGPLVTAAVFVNKETQKELKQAGVRDSKDLNENQITELSKLIKHTAVNNYEIVKINPAKYNQLYDKFKNLNKLLNWAHSKAIDTLLQKTNCKTVITDKFSNKDLIVTSNVNHSSVEFIQETKAEKFVGVAAASILARNEFNQWFNQQRKLGHNFPKGSSEAVTEAASKLFKQLSGNKMDEYVKLHFKTLTKIQQH